VKNAIGSINKHHVIVTSAPNTNMPTLMAQQNTTKKHRNESDIEANLIFSYDQWAYINYQLAI
jgi:hypothetical protein